MQNGKILCKIVVYAENKEKYYYAKITDKEMKQISLHIKNKEYENTIIESVDGDKVPINSIIKIFLA